MGIRKKHNDIIIIITDYFVICNYIKAEAIEHRRIILISTTKKTSNMCNLFYPFAVQTLIADSNCKAACLTSIGPALRQPSKHKTFVHHFYNVGPTSSTLVQHCINVIQMFYIY